MTNPTTRTLRHLCDAVVSWDEALDGLNESGHAARELATELARRADGAQARRLLAAVKAYDESGPGRYLLATRVQALIENGTYEPLLGLPT